MEIKSHNIGIHWSWPWEYVGQWPFEFRCRVDLVAEFPNTTLLWMFSCPLFDLFEHRLYR